MARTNRGSTLKYALIGGIALLAVLSAAALTQSIVGGSTASLETDTAPLPTHNLIPSKTPMVSTTQPKITYSGYTAPSLKPYGGNSDSGIRDPAATDYVAQGYRTTFESSSPLPTLSTRITVATVLSTNSMIPSTSHPLTRQTEIERTIRQPNPVSITPIPITEDASPTPNPTVPTAVITDPGTTTSYPAVDTNPPVILSVTPERSTINAGETVRFDVIVVSEIPLETGHWSIVTPVGGHYSTSHTVAKSIGGNRWKFVIEERTSDYWLAGEVKLVELDVSDEISLKSDTWSTPVIVQITNPDYRPAERPVIISITPDRTEISAGENAYFSVLVRSTVPVGHYGFSHYSYMSPVGGSRLNGGLDFRKSGDDSWQAKIRIETYPSWPSGDVVLTELVVNNAAEQSSDLWTIPVKIHVKDGSDAGADSPRILSVTPDQSEITAGETAFFTVTVQAHTRPGYPGFCYYQASTPTGGHRANGGMSFTKIGEDLWRTSLEVQTSRYAVGKVTITEVGVGNEAQRVSDPWRGSATITVVPQ